MESENIGLIVGLLSKQSDTKFVEKLKEARKNNIEVLLLNYNLVDENGISVELSKEDLDSINIENEILKNKGSITTNTGKTVYISDVEYYTLDDSGNIIKKDKSNDNYEDYYSYLDTDTNSLILNETGEVISSDFDFVNESMESLVLKLDVGNKLKYASKDGEAGLLESIHDISEYYKNILAELFDKLYSEAGAISSIADAYSGLDMYASGMASNLTGDGYYDGGGGSYSPSQRAATTNINADEVRAKTKTAIEAVKASANSETFDKITNFLGTNIEAGKIGIVNVNDLGSSIDNVVKSLEKDSASSTAALGDLNAFMQQIGSDKTLSGTSWENVKLDCETYKSLLNLSIESSEYLTAVLKTAQQMISDFLYPDTELDDRVLPTLEASLEKVIAEITRLSAQLAQMKASQHLVTETDKDGNVISSYLDPSDADIQAVADSIKEYEAQQKELEAEIKRINDFAVVVNNAQKMINDSVDQIKTAFANPTKGTQGNETFSANFTLDLSTYGIMEGTKSKDLIEAYYAARDARIEAASKPVEPSKNPLLEGLDGNTKLGKYTVDQIRGMSESEIKNMDIEDFIDLVGSAAQIIYKERGGVLPSITIAQAIYETGKGKHFPTNSYNLYGLIGYPSGKAQTTGGLRMFEDILESTLYHATYFEHYENKCYKSFMKACRNNDPYLAAEYLPAYDCGHQSYAVAVKSILKRYNLPQYDNI